MELISVYKYHNIENVNFTQKEDLNDFKFLIFWSNSHNSDNMSSNKISPSSKKSFQYAWNCNFYAMNQVFICIQEYEYIDGYFAQRIPLVKRIFKWHFWKYLQSWHYNLSF